MTIKVTYNVTDVYMSQSVSPVYITVSYSDGGASGGGVWGSITGTLSNQTDLQTALDAKLDESTIDGGAEGQILVKNSATDFDFAWINNYAKYLATNVRNQTGSTIGAFQVVYISGATGNKPLISLADADTEATSSKTYGVTATSIANNGTGDVVTAGELSGIDTSAFTEGDSLWLSTTAGGIVTSPPAEPAHAVFIGTVIRSHPTLGVIDVAIQNGYELTELHGVDIVSEANNDGLFYNSSNSLWENKTVSEALGYTPANAATTLTINGVTYDLSTSRTWTIAAGISGSGASGQVTYWTGASAVSGSNNLFWDNTNGRLGIGTNAPTDILDIRKDQVTTSVATTTSMLLTNSNANGIAAYVFTSDGTTRQGGLQYNNQTGFRNLFSCTYTNIPYYFGTNNTVRLTITGDTGNVMVGTTSDLGVRFGVSGNTLLRGSGNTSATTALTVQNSASSTMMSISNDAANTILNVTGSTSSVFQANQTTANRNVYFGSQSTFADFYVGSAITSFRFLNNIGHGLVRINTAPFPTGGGNLVEIPLFATAFAPTSGTADFTALLIRPTINQTGGANGITYGLRVAPIITAAADWRSIEWSNNSGWGLYGAGTANNYLGGNVAIGSTSNTTDWLNIAASTTAKAHIYLAAGVAPTSPANGDIWFDGTDIKMRIGGVTKTFTLI